jgi:hypothetical protein
MTFDDVNTGKPVYINPARVWYVEPQSEDTTSIVFGVVADIDGRGDAVGKLVRGKAELIADELGLNPAGFEVHEP